MDKLESVKVAGSEKQHTVKYGDVLFTGSSERADEAGMSSAVTEKIENSIYLNSFSFGPNAFHSTSPSSKFNNWSR
jgi:type I restriction enzyme S subunit